MIRNPILPGFNPDPSICRVGDDYYIATSTFEWYPGVQIHHSRDLVNWGWSAARSTARRSSTCAATPIAAASGRRACRYADGLFWLVYTDVKRYDGNFKDTHNYIVTAPAIEGPWSDPVYVNSSRLRPLAVPRRRRPQVVRQHAVEPPTAGRRRQSEDSPPSTASCCRSGTPKAKKLVGPVKNIFARHRRWGWSRARISTSATAGTTSPPPRAAPATTTPSPWRARARSTAPTSCIRDTHPITSKDAPDAPLQRAGHGQIVETPDGQVYHTHLCGRPLPGTRRSPLGRETAIQKCVWRDDGWLYLDARRRRAERRGRGARPARRSRARRRRCRYDFAGAQLPLDFQWLRTPEPERIFTLTGKPACCGCSARESIGSWFEQALVARRQEHFCFRAETAVDFRARRPTSRSPA